MPKGITLSSRGLQVLAKFMLNRQVGLVKPAVAIGTSKEKIQIAAATCLNNGLTSSILTAQDEDILTGITGLASTTKVEAIKILISAQADGTIVATGGAILIINEKNGVVFDTDETAAEHKARCELPKVPDNEAPLGEVYVLTAAAETFVFGTTELDANATNAVYKDLVWPDSGPDAFDVTAALT